ncbi:MAG: D,D-dipeptide ABC transporter permease, partial [Gluconobacter albidus]
MTMRLPSVLRRLLSHPRGMVPAFYVPAIIVLCAIGPWLLPFGELHVDLYHRFLPPLGDGHLLGTDEIGRDVLSRVLMG